VERKGHRCYIVKEKEGRKGKKEGVRKEVKKKKEKKNQSCLGFLFICL
jgi:hypothetical protein